MGVVYKARHLKLNRLVALKMVLAGGHASGEALVRFLGEAEAVAALQHPHIVQLYDSGQLDGLPFFTLEYVPGGSLAGKLGGAPLPPKQAARLVEQLAWALHFAHAKGIVHRDLKPANVLLMDDGSPKITDFGLAKRVEVGQGLTASGDVMGTPSYMAPEQAAGDGKRVGPAADTYALGAILYECLTGRPPFKAATALDTVLQVVNEEAVSVRHLQPRAPADLETICHRCLQKEPAKRYPSAQALAEDLRRFQVGEPIRARPVGSAERAWRWCRRNPWVAGSLAAAVGVLVACTAVSLYFGFAAKGQARQARDAQGRAEAKEEEVRTERDRARQAEAQANRQLAQAHFNRGLALCEQGETAVGLQWLLESLRTAPADDTAFRLLVRANLAAWTEAAPALRYVLRHDPLEAAAYRPDGKVLATVGKDRRARLWDAATGTLLRTLDHPEKVYCVAFSPDGKTLVTGGDSDAGKPHGIYLWDADAGRLLDRVETPGDFVSSVCFTPDGRRVVAGTSLPHGTGEVRVWDAATRKPSGSPAAGPGIGRLLGFLPDGHTLLTRFDLGWGGGHYELRELNSGRRVGESWDVQTTEGLLLPGGTTLLVDDSPKTLTRPRAAHLTLCWRDVLTGRERRAGVLTRGAFRSTLTAVSPDGRTCWFGRGAGWVDWRDAATGRLLTSFPSDPKGGASPLCSQGTLCAVGSWLDRSNAVQVWEVPRTEIPGTEQVAGESGGAAGPDPAGLGYQRLAFSPDRALALLGGWGKDDDLRGGTARLVETATGRPLGPPLRHPWDKVRCVAFSPDGRTLAVGYHPADVAGAVQLWDGGTGRPLHPPLPMTNYPSALAFSPDGTLLATGDYHQAVRLWDVATGRPSGRPLIHPEVILSVAFSPDGKTLAAGTADDRSGQPQARLWDVATGQPRGSPLRHTSRVYHVTFSPDGRTLLTADQGGRLRRWNVATGALLGALPAELLGWFPQGGFPQGIPFSPDGRTFLTGNSDGLARLWDAATGQPVRGATLQLPATVSSGAYSPDGKLAVVGCDDGTVRLWDLATFHPVGPPAQLRRSVLAVAFLPDGRSYVAVDRSGRSRRWPVPVPVEDDPERLALRLQVRTGLRMGPDQDVLVPGLEEWEARRQELVRLEGSAESACRFTVSEADWHETCAADAEEDGNVFAAVWHLDRLIALRPEDWVLDARRGRAHSVAGQLEQAAADYVRAREHAAGDALLHWYQHRAVDCKVAEQWPAALWYLDRVAQVLPDDWMTHRDRADALARLGKPDESLAALEKAVAAGADPPTVLRLAELLARRGKWERTAALLGDLQKQGRVPSAVVHLHAVALLQAGDAATYRRLCRHAAEVVAAGQVPPEMANDVAWLFVLGPEAVPAYGPIVRLAEQAVSSAKGASKYTVLNTLGAVLYRAGRYQDAVARLNEAVALKDKTGAVQDWLFLALAHQRLGQADEAKKWLDRAVAAPPAKGDDHYWENAEVELLRREAQRLLGNSPREPAR
jgi:WD40 repeat protein